MHKFVIKFLENPVAGSSEMEFDAFDAAYALWVAHEDPAARSAEVWRDGRALCTLRRAGPRNELWQIEGLTEK